jgi:hypothetical protein
MRPLDLAAAKLPSRIVSRGERRTIRWRRQWVIERDRLPNLLYASREILDLPGVGVPVLINIAKIEPSIGVGGLAQLGTLMVLVNELDGLFEADRDEDADRDRTDVNEEVFPGVIGLLRRVNVDHGASKDVPLCSKVEGS